MDSIQQALPLILLVSIFYFLLIRPQQKRVRQHRVLMSSVVVGDEVLTVGGLYGTVRDLDDATMELEISPGTLVKFSRQAISRKITPDDAMSDGEQSIG